MLSQSIQRIWYQTSSAWILLLLPFSLLYCFLSILRRCLYHLNILQQVRLRVPVVVVGNINVGGTGKTPLVVAITQFLKAQGYSPGVISRGYGGKASQWPQPVFPDSAPALVGDEAVLIADRCRCPVAVGPDRVATAKALLAENNCDVIVSDDGLQHYRMMRDVEVVVIDGVRRFGNGLCLPAGPLRELPYRLKKADLIVANGAAQTGEYAMELKSYAFHNVNDESQLKSLDDFNGKTAHAVAGIGNNERFFQQLKSLGIHIKEHPFPDHFRYTRSNLHFNDDRPILMTEKDAVKCKKYSIQDAWYLKVDAVLGNQFYEKLTESMRRHNGQKIT